MSMSQVRRDKTRVSRRIPLARRWLLGAAVVVPAVLLGSVFFGSADAGPPIAASPPSVAAPAIQHVASVEPSTPPAGGLAPGGPVEPQPNALIDPTRAGDGQALRSPAESAPGGKPGAATATKDPSKFDCLIEPRVVVSIGSPITGLIEAVNVERGDSVEAGQVVAQLESSVEKAAVKLAQLRAQVDGAIKSRETSMALGVKRLDRANQLFRNHALSLDLRDEAETGAEVARLDLQQARENQRLASLELEQAIQMLNRRTVRTPVSGVVVDRLMSAGEIVDKQTILTVAQVDPLRVEVVLPSAMFGSVRTDMRAAVEPEHPGDRVHVASVKIVDRIIDAASGTFRVLLDLPNPDRQIPGGLHCQVRFLTD